MFSVHVEMSSRPHRSYFCVLPLQVSSSAEGGKFGRKKQETTSASLCLPAEPDLPVQYFGGLPSVGMQIQAAQGLRSRKFQVGVIPGCSCLENS